VAVTRWRALGAVVIVIGLLIATPQAVSAECDGPAVSFRDRAPEAPVVVIGDVSSIEPDASERDERGRANRFTLQVRYVLRGEAPSSMFLSERPSGPCSGDILARPGDRLAMALGLTDKLLFGEKTWAAVAWIRGIPLEYEGIERTTVASAFRLLGLEAPETTTVSTAPGPVSPFGWMVLMTVLVAAATRFGIASGRRRPPS
jgi:hypothetical protein